MQIEVINVTGPSAVPGKKYKIIEVAFKFDGKVSGKKLLDFANPSLFLEVAKWQQGQFYEVSTKKDDNGYWQWINAALVDGSSAAAPAAATKSIGDFKKGNEDRYETADERKLRQKYIIRQSSIS
jgi:hypothetical protein